MTSSYQFTNFLTTPRTNMKYTYLDMGLHFIYFHTYFLFKTLLIIRNCLVNTINSGFYICFIDKYCTLLLQWSRVKDVMKFISNSFTDPFISWYIDSTSIFYWFMAITSAKSHIVMVSLFYSPLEYLKNNVRFLGPKLIM